MSKVCGNAQFDLLHLFPNDLVDDHAHKFKPVPLQFTELGDFNRDKFVQLMKEETDKANRPSEPDPSTDLKTPKQQQQQKLLQLPVPMKGTRLAAKLEKEKEFQQQ